MRKRHPTRRGFLKRCSLGASVWAAARSSALSARESGREEIFESYRDERTGARVYNLTPGDHKDIIVYQTHPQWTAGMAYLVFNSDRSGGAMRPHAVELTTGAIRPLFEQGGGGFAMTWRSGALYFVDTSGLFVVDVVRAFQEKAAPRRVASLPTDYAAISGGLTVDTREDTLYMGVELEAEKRWGIMALDVQRGEWRKVVETEFRVGHQQANPHVPGQIMFCHETGGDAGQRMWFVNADGAGLRPFYKETYGEWVTHEVWWGPDKAIFTIWPYDDAHKKLPHGIACADLATGPEGAMTILSQYPAWHTHGSPDGRWAMGDDFDRNIWLVDVEKKERRLLTQGHLGKGFKTHPHGSFTPDSRAIIFNSSRNGSEDILLAEIPAWESLPPATGA